MIFKKISKRMTQAILLLSVLAVGLVAPATTTIVTTWETVVHAEDYSGTSGGCDWAIVNNVLSISPSPEGNGVLAQVTKNPKTVLDLAPAVAQTITSVNISEGVKAPVNSQYLFSGLYFATAINGLQNLDTQNVTNMQNMFYECYHVTNLDLKSFNTHNVTNMQGMFKYVERAESIEFNKEISTYNVTNMANMFDGCFALQLLDLNGFNTENVTNMGSMFNDCKALQSITFGMYFTAIRVTNMAHMFDNCLSLLSLDLTNFATSEVKDMRYMFNNCKALETLTLTSRFHTYQVTDMRYMFNDCWELKALSLSSFDTSNVLNMDRMFCECYNLLDLDVSTFDTSKVTSMERMFCQVERATQITFSSDFTTNNITNMEHLFEGCRALKSLDLSSFNTNNVTNMESMFDNCWALESINFGDNFSTNIVTNFKAMFFDCYNLKQLDVSKFNTHVSSTMERMFSNCVSLETLDLYNFGAQNTTNTTDMFKCETGYSSLWKIRMAHNLILNSETGLQDAIPGTIFDSKYAVDSTAWRVGNWDDAHNPEGDELPAADIGTYNNTHATGENKTNTYVWQGNLIQHTVTVNYLDTDAEDAVVDSETLAGDIDTGYTVTDEKLDALKVQGYELVNADAGYPNGVYDSDKTVNVYLKHGTTLNETTKTVKQTIHYVDSNQKTLVHDNVQELTFTHYVTIDNVTHATLSDTWSPEQTTKAITSPDLAGYTTLIKVVGGQVYSHESDAENVINVVYTANVPVPPVPVPPVPTPPTPVPVPTPTPDPAPFIGPDAVVVQPGLAPAVTNVAPIAGTPAVQAVTPTTDDTITAPTEDDNVVKDSTDSAADKDVEAADTQTSPTAWWPLAVGSLAVAGVLAGWWFLLFRRRRKDDEDEV
ncbi:MAG: BspA family leucine-rich repeat surface protein [Lactobacillaceae bacterium]|jgi:surface protein|nr:BspA family leucine-rich repeat surface protein [Lactobacillaceae bacterium]